MKKDKDFDAVTWTRQIRDSLNRKYKELPARAFVRKLSEEGEKSTFGKKLAQRFEAANPSTRSSA